MVQALNKSGQIKSLSFTAQQFKSVMSGDEKSRVEALKELLDYPIAQRDPQGSRFWFLRPGENTSAAADTQPIAVGFYDELNSKSDREIKEFLTSPEQQQVIYGHYLDRVNEDQPVMYILLPSKEETGRVALVLPTEGKLRQRQIQTFEWNSTQLLNSRLPRLHQDSLPIADKALVSTPLVEWVFYDSVATAKELAQRLAEVTKQIEKIIPAVYAAESSNGYLHQLLTSFQKELLPNLKVSSTDEKEYSFADIYAQTVAYGLFTARVFSYERHKDDFISTGFNRQTAWDLLPETNPFLRRLFQDISERSPLELGDELIEAIVEIISYLRVAKMEVILRDFHQKIDREDIVIRFYEDFLKTYKQKMQKLRGVYYTPEPVVSYMVRSVDELLKDKFNKPLGIADPEVMILDPACGTGTFLLWIFQLIHKRFQESPEALTVGLEDKSWSGYVRERLLPRVFGFELLMAPYAIAHLKLGLFLEETGYQFDSGKRLGVYLTNTLEKPTKKSELLLEEFIAEESSQAADIKQEKPIMVVIGNPPYSVSSANSSEWISNLIKDYKKDLTEKKLNLDDDFIKFIRAAQWRIDSTGHGIVSFISSNTFLDGITHRRMRESLMNSFDDIWTLDLHGSIKKKEKCPDGSKDENIFDIQQGVSINLFAKYLQFRQESNIYHADMWGLRDNKYQQLKKSSICSTSWNDIVPKKNYFFFCHKDFSLSNEYNQAISVVEIFSRYVSGIQTKRDSVAIAYSKEEIIKTLQDLLELECEEFRRKYNVGSDGTDWSIFSAKQNVKDFRPHCDYITGITYRPFDNRYTWFTNRSRAFLGRPRYEIMQNLIDTNLALIFERCPPEQHNYSFVTNQITDLHSLGTAYCNAYTAPLYFYSDSDDIQKSILKNKRNPNLSQDFLDDITEKLDYLPTTEAIFYYIYAVLHSPTYRDRYAEFLKIDFPRVPLTSNDKLFRQLADYGEQLVQLHLMTSPKLDDLITEFVEGTGERTVAPAHPKYQNGTVQINKNGDKFTGVPEEVWNFYVGGYQPCQKWLKDRKGRTLSDEDILHYQKIVVSLKETIELMTKIDQAIPNFPIQ
ncbi:MAG TPA: type ISP restriction/modification enzyme [Coleofasciculaceae cyanobacterium]